MPDPKLEVILAARDMTQKAFSTFERRIRSAKTSIFSLQGTLATFGIGYGIKELAGSFLDVAGSFEQMELKLNAITKGKGAETLESLNQWALDMPVNTRKTVDAFAMMGAMGLDPTIKKMETLVDVSVIFGEDTMPRVARALGQMQTLGKLSAEELNQLAEAGINARQYLKDAFGMGVEELKKSSVSIEQIIQAIMEGMDRDFGGAAKNAMNNWQGLKATTVSYLEEIQRRIMDAGLLTEIKKQLGGVNDELKGWLNANEQLIQLKVPEYVERTKDALQKIWDIISYDPDIIKYGIVGLAIGGRKGAVLFGSLGHMKQWAENLSAALGMSSAGLIDFKEIAMANFQELEELVKKGEAMMTGQLKFPMPNRPGGPTTDGDGPGPTSGAPGGHIATGDQSVWNDYVNQQAYYNQIVEEAYLAHRDNLITMEGGLYTTRNDYLQQNLKYQQIVNDAKFRADQDLAKRTIAQEKNVAMQKKAIAQWSLGVTSSFLNSLYVLTGQSNEGLFQMHKYAAIAEGTIKAYLAAANTLGTAPWPINYGAAAMALAQGLAIVAGMQSVSIGGGGGGVSIGGGMPAYTTPTIPELDTGEEDKKGSLTIIIQGDFIGDEAYVDDLVDKINKAQEERNVTLIASESRYASEVV